ncbi:MAG TPA: hypothetical protein VFJ91_09215 [Gaiellaceae bacterium]|nr:hypothetical protein [Gaiellaceae bacterium]
MDWTVVYTDPDELRSAFAGYPDARYRPITAWWWSGEPVTEERVLWQLDRIAEMGSGGFDITGLAMHGPAAGSVADDPKGLSDEWYRFYRLACERARDLGLGVATWSPLQVGAPVDAAPLLERRPELRGEELVTVGGVDARPFGLDYGNPEAIAAHSAPGTATHEFLERLDDLFGNPIVAFFEDEFPAFPRWAPGFAEEFRAAKGYDFPLEAVDQDVGPRTPAHRVALFDVATERVLGAYTRFQKDFVRKHNLLAAYDQCSRRGTPLLTSLYHLDQFKTMAWANAPGTDQMGDARFHLSLADIYGSPRVWLEGFHSHGHGMSLDDQMRLIREWGREGASLFLPHGGYYANRALWWEWAPPEIGWNQPYARHYPAFAETVGRLLMCLSAGRHVPEIAVLYPQTTVWADTEGTRRWGAAALEADRCYTALMGMHSIPSGWDLERSDKPSLLAEAFYDRITVDEEHVSLFDVPIVLPACLCLRTETVERLIADAEAGRTVVVVEPRPAWSAENGREDERFLALVERLCELATVVGSAEEAVAALPPPRVDGLKAQWRRVGDLDLVYVTGSGRVRLRGVAGRAPERWSPESGSVEPVAATVDGDDLLLDLPGPDALLALPAGTPLPPEERPTRTVELPAVWECSYPEWGENRWGDYRLPGNPGTPPAERRTFAFREGDDPAWRSAPVVPEDVQQPLTELGFEQRMGGVYGRVAPKDRWIADGWREVVSTYGPKAVVTAADGEERLGEYSERLGVEDLILSTPIGLKGRVEPVKVDLGPRGAGSIRSWCRVEAPVETHLVVEGHGVLTVHLDGERLIGPVEGGVLSIPVRLAAGWHEVRIDAEPRAPVPSPAVIYRPPPRTKLGWGLTEPYRRAPSAVWTWQVIHPDYKGDPGPRRFRRLVRVSEPTRLRVDLRASGPLEVDAPELLDPGEHAIEVTVGRGLFRDHLVGSLLLESDSGTVEIATDDRWEVVEDVARTVYPDRLLPGEEQPIAGGEAESSWVGVFQVGLGGTWMGAPDDPEGEGRRHLLTDVAWLEGEEVLQGQAPQLWADAPDAPPPAWFCFLAPPGARSLTLPVVGEVEAWLDGEPARIEDGVLALREGARVALRVQAPPGFRGAACFREHPLLELGDGRIEVGPSWHRQGLDVFAGVIVHRTTVTLDEDADALLELGSVRGSVAARVNGEPAGVAFSAPWRIPLRLRAGENVLELEVANTLGSLAGRGVPTPFGPEDQRFSGLLERPRLLLPA